MTGLMARASALAAIGLLVASLGALILASQPSLTGGTRVRAEFSDVYPLRAGMDVREYGALAGTVEDITLTDHGTVVVKLVMKDGVPVPRIDASAAIREQDITGSTYLALEPGKATTPLGDRVIPRSRTIVAPRFEDLLSALDAPVRQATQIILAQLGSAVEARGGDLNRALLSLRPALTAADEALTEVAGQNATLKTLIGDAEHVTGQAAARSRELGALIDALDTTLSTTAQHSGALDRALAAAPQATGRGVVTLRKLTAVLEHSRPLAQTLGHAAPQLLRSAQLAGPFIDDVEPLLDDVEPTLALLSDTLKVARPTLAAGSEHVLTAPFDIAGSAGRLLSTLLANKDLLPGLFGATGYGKGEKRSGLGSLAVELGTQRGYPADFDPKRFFLRAVAIPSCETFGLPIKPGCLAAAARKVGVAHDAPAKAKTTTGRPAASGGVLPAVKQVVGGAAEPAPAGPLPKLGAAVGKTVEQTTRDVNGLLDYLLGR